jgi:hypothetical protein
VVEAEPPWSEATTMKKKFPKRTPEEKAHSLEVRRRAIERLEYLKRRDAQRAAERRTTS